MNCRTRAISSVLIDTVYVVQKYILINIFMAMCCMLLAYAIILINSCDRFPDTTQVFSLVSKQFDHEYMGKILALNNRKHNNAVLLYLIPIRTTSKSIHYTTFFSFSKMHHESNTPE